MKPKVNKLAVRITDKAFKYTPSFATDLRKKFRAIELERKRAQQATQPSVIVQIRKGSK